MYFPSRESTYQYFYLIKIMNRVIFHIDMNSYFASVAQHFDTELRNRPVAVMGKGKGTVVIAASKEAKKYGIKTGTHKYDAVKMCPDIVFVPPAFDKYVQTTAIILQVFHEFTPLVEPFSIDEAFLEMTNTYWICMGMHPVDVAYMIKKRMRERLGDVITCSVGIADNKLMAKFGSDLKKPDGIVFLTPDRYMDVLDHSNLQEICGIGRRTFAHLERLGIKNFRQLRDMSYIKLKKEFGPVQGKFLHLAAHGENHSRVNPSAFFNDPKSVSHAETFTENWSGVDLMSKIYKLCEKVSLRLRTKELYAGCVHIYIKDHNFKGVSFEQKLAHPTNNTIEIFHALSQHISQNFVSRFVCIWSHDLVRERIADLFDETLKYDRLQMSLDRINTKYGHFSILPASIKKPTDLDNPVDIPFSGLDNDAKTGKDLTTLLRQRDVILHKVLHQS